MKGISLRDLPSFIRTTDPTEYMFNFTMEAAQRSTKATGLIIHTFDALEPELVNTLSSMFPNVYTIGPQQLLLNQIPSLEEEHVKRIRERGTRVPPVAGLKTPKLRGIRKLWKHNSHVTSAAGGVWLGTC